MHRSTLEGEGFSLFGECMVWFGFCLVYNWNKNLGQFCPEKIKRRLGTWNKKSQNLKEQITKKAKTEAGNMERHKTEVR